MEMDISGFGNGVEKIKHSWRKMVLVLFLLLGRVWFVWFITASGSELMAFRGMTTGLPEKGNSLKLPEANRELQR